MKLCELLFYQSAVFSNSFPTNPIMQSYFNPRWSVTNYSDPFNIPPITFNFLRFWSPNTSPPAAIYTSFTSNMPSPYSGNNSVIGGFFNLLIYGFNSAFSGNNVQTTDHLTFSINQPYNITGIKIFF